MLIPAESDMPTANLFFLLRKGLFEIKSDHLGNRFNGNHNAREIAGLASKVLGIF